MRAQLAAFRAPQARVNSRGEARFRGASCAAARRAEVCESAGKVRGAAGGVDTRGTGRYRGWMIATDQRAVHAAHAVGEQSGIDFAAERIALACAFRWAARYDLHESVANHFSLAVNNSGTRFLMNPRGRHFSLVRASELLLLDAEDERTLQRPDAPDPTAWGLHGAIHRRVPHARCLLHVHARYATVLACLADPTLPPIDQNAMRFWGRVTVDDQFEGMGVDDEAERVAALAGDNPILLLRNHGVMVIGETVAQAFDDLYYFERSCETYITALQTGRELKIVADRVAARTARQWLDYPDLSNDHFRELQAILDREDPSYRD